MTFSVRAIDIRQSLVYDLVLVDGVIMLMTSDEAESIGLFGGTWSSTSTSIEPLYLARVRNGLYTTIIGNKTVDGMWIENGLLHIQHDLSRTSIPIGTLYYFMRRSMSRQLRSDEYTSAVRRYARCLVQACRDVDTLSHISYTMILVNTSSGTYAVVLEYGYNLFGLPSTVLNAVVVAKREEDEWIDLMTNDYAEHVELSAPDIIRFVGEGDYNVEYKLYEVISWYKLAEPQLSHEAQKIRQWIMTPRP